MFDDVSRDGGAFLCHCGLAPAAYESSAVTSPSTLSKLTPRTW